MDFRLTPRQARLKADARALTDFIAAYEERCEEDNGLPAGAHAEIRDAVLDAGLQAVNMPAEWGGAGLTVAEQVTVQEELGRLTGALWDMVWRPANALRFCTPEQRERFLVPVIRGERRDCYAVTERGAGSDPQNIATTATKTDQGWVLNGEKWFVTVGDHADFMIVLAAAGPGRAPTLFLVDKDTPGIEMTRVPRFMHTFVYEHPEFTFTDVQVGPDAVLGGIGEGYDITRSWFTEERLMIAARTTGAAERALELARDWAVEREQFGAPIASYQLVQGMLADCAVDIAVNRAYTHQVAWEVDRASAEDRKTLHAKAAIAKLAASEASGRVVDRCLQIHGGRGYDRAFAVERLYRELRVDRIWEGTSEIQRLIIANELVKRGTGVLELPVA
ncbi:acyl-CoA dehydrogenase family protein [Streptomyces collinus]|uniref:Acyl-CoA dehydrogenase domain-containing protein n=1 Tax=Streptomyces collinus (strain DSM 40733 / Tue 365) TaxID=1214242 RepID=S5UWQ6_STRC3|nr:acyl-CoA dehydrogenase family protein [Streptomyces collinus]AGS67464.1 acyl-CoA dehydrogenase domain-containing protein [Streptomyces collinus Tu 365]UJA06145.1 acyl-CoA dehydrogenase [Streptomyces collinus]UJA12685.1 acyl-CoA dehydrogenase [Streptomyces collinus]